MIGLSNEELEEIRNKLKSNKKSRIGEIIIGKEKLKRAKEGRKNKKLNKKK